MKTLTDIQLLALQSYANSQPCWIRLVGLEPSLLRISHGAQWEGFNSSIQNEVTLMTLGRSKKAKIRKHSRSAHRIVIRDASVKFFYDNAGYSYDPRIETREQGRLRCAQSLAKAERYASEQGWLYEWSQDPEGCIGGDCGETATCDHPCCQGTSHDCRVCLLWDADSTKVLASLGSICEPSTEYLRVIEAELALEAMPNGVR